MAERASVSSPRGPHVLAVTHEATRTGSVIAFVEAVTALRAVAGRVSVVATAPGPMLTEIEKLADIVLVQPRRHLWQLRRLARFSILRAAGPVVESLVARAVVADLEPDFVYTSSVISCQYAQAALDQEVPHLLHVHEQNPLTEFALARHGVSRSHLKCACPSEFVLAELQALGVTNATVVRGPLSVSPVNAHREPAVETFPAYTVVSIGTISESKGINEWIQMVRALSTVGGQPIHWIWVGGGAVEALTQELERLGLAGRAKCVGEQADVRPWLDRADVVLVPSHAETLGLVALEALGRRRPVVAFSVGGLPEVLRDHRALAPAGDVEALLDRLKRALTDRELRDALVSSGAPAVREAAPEHWRAKLIRTAVAAGMRVPENL